jgi:phage/conjugal plasmid C-4 type zinc finger TraR family protein
MDFADEATAAQALHLADCLARIRTRPGTMQEPPRDHPGGWPAECDECGEPIPEGRRLAVPGVRLCVSCQEARE